MSQEAPGCLGAIFRLFGPSTKAEPETGTVQFEVYRVRDDLLSAAEASFFRVLRLSVGEAYAIFPKVCLGDLFYVTPPNGNQGARNRIASKHVDFVICDPITLRPVAGLELDDSSHQKAKAVKNDSFKDGLFAAAGLPLIRVPTQRAYEPAQVRALLSPVLRLDGAPVVPAVSDPAAPPPAAGDAPPACPKCGVPMALRTAQRGDNRGSSFWGCVNYPRCRQVITAAGE